MANLPRLSGTPELPIQIEESYLGGRRKYNVGRLLSGDSKVPGRWLSGMCTTSKHVRFTLVPNRQATTLIPLIESQVVQGSKIWSDKWAA